MDLGEEEHAGNDQDGDGEFRIETTAVDENAINLGPLREACRRQRTPDEGGDEFRIETTAVDENAINLGPLREAYRRQRTPDEGGEFRIETTAVDENAINLGPLREACRRQRTPDEGGDEFPSTSGIARFSITDTVSVNVDKEEDDSCLYSTVDIHSKTSSTK